MKIHFDAVLHDLENKPLTNGEKEFTLGMALANALLASYPDEQNLPGSEKVKRFKLAEKAYAGGEQEVSVEDAALIKTLVAKAYNPLIVGRVYEIIE